MKRARRKVGKGEGGDIRGGGKENVDWGLLRKQTMKPRLKVP